MSANFGLWPPASPVKTIGVCSVVGDGTLSVSSRYRTTGLPVFSSEQLGVGEYRVTPGRAALHPHWFVTVIETGDGRYATCTPTLGPGFVLGTVDVHTFDDAGAPADTQFQLTLLDY